MRRHFRLEQGHRLDTAGLAEKALRETRSLALLHRRGSLEVGKRESRLAVAPVSGAEEREQGGILRDWQKLAGAHRPAFGCEVEGEDADFSDEGTGHANSPK